MPDDKDEGSGFKVVDRRPFATDGSVRESSDETPPAPPKIERPAEPVPAPAQSGSRAVEVESPEEDAEAAFDDLGDSDQAPLSGFDTLVSYLGTTAMFQLGLMAGPSGERIPADLVNARQTINMLEVLDQKTQGNLTQDEGRLLDDVLYELRMAYVEVDKRTSKPK
jgi:Domain of unknown function (DUF1844)